MDSTQNTYWEAMRRVSQHLENQDIGIDDRINRVHGILADYEKRLPSEIYSELYQQSKRQVRRVLINDH